MLSMSRRQRIDVGAREISLPGEEDKLLLHCITFSASLLRRHLCDSSTAEGIRRNRNAALRLKLENFRNETTIFGVL